MLTGGMGIAGVEGIWAGDGGDWIAAVLTAQGGKVGIGGKRGGIGRKRGGRCGELGVLCCMGGLYGACGGLREYIWPADAVHVGVAAQRAENEGVRR